MRKRSTHLQEDNKTMTTCAHSLHQTLLCFYCIESSFFFQICRRLLSLLVGCLFYKGKYVAKWSCSPWGLESNGQKCTRHLRKSCSNARAFLLIFMGAWTSLQSGSPCDCNGPVLPINPLIVTEQVKNIQLSILRLLNVYNQQWLMNNNGLVSMCVCVLACVCVSMCLPSLTPSLFCPLLASISCRARTDRDCSSTKVQMHRSGGTYCNNREVGSKLTQLKVLTN